ncbi:MAG: hypothetical protein WCF96_07735, partial [Eubacteriales bacterium]
GVMQSHTGIVEGVTLYNGNAEVILDGASYPISSVMEVKTPVITIPDASTLLSGLTNPATLSNSITDISGTGDDVVEEI